MPHANATLTERGRLYLARCVVEDGWPLRRAAERFQVSHNTARRWAERYRQLGVAGMVDRPSRPHRSPNRTPIRLERKVLHLRRKKRLGPAAIAGRLGMHRSTAHRVLRRYGEPRLATLDLATGQPIRKQPVRRYEWPHPGDLVHVDIKKLGRIPDGGGHRPVGRTQGNRNRARTPGVIRGRHPGIGYSYIHSAVDDHSRLAYSEVLADEQGATAAAFWQRAHAFFAAHAITVQRVLTDNGSCYRSRIWRSTLAGAGVVHKRTRPYRPQTNGKVERYKCATSHLVVSPVQPGGTRREVLGSDGLPVAERWAGTRACQEISGRVQMSGTVRWETRVIWRKLDCLNPNLQKRQVHLRRNETSDTGASPASRC